VARRPVVLEKTWARRFGVRRSGGMYRIAHWELMKRLIELGQTPLEETAGSLAAPSGATDPSRLWAPTAV
jgi:hypothetical protein